MTAIGWVQHFAQRGRVGDVALRLMSKIEGSGTLGALGKEVVGINAPKIIRVRGFNEFIDSFTNEFGNTVGYFGAGYGLNAIIDKAFKKIMHHPAFVTGKSILLNVFPASILYAMPFIRNYLTAQRTGTTRFVDIIGLGGFLPPQSKAEFEKDKRRYLNTAIGVLGGALAIGLAGLAHGASRAKKGLAFATSSTGQKIEAWWAKHFNFTKGHFKAMTDATGLWFWGLPAYTGWIHASRETSERIEQGIKMLNFFAMFYFLDVGIQKLLGTAKTYNPEIIAKLKAQVAGKKGIKKLNFSRANLETVMKELNYDAAKQQKYLKVWGTHRMVGYLASMFGLFLSNYIASSLSIASTNARVKREKSKLGAQAVHAFDRIGWQSPVTAHSTPSTR